MISFYTRDGRTLDLENIRFCDVNIHEIANALANQGRYNGQTWEFYSVAQHSVLLSMYAEQEGYDLNTQRALLLHDASEAFCGDIVYHLKQKLPSFQELETKIIKIIFDRYGVDYDSIKDVVHWLDRAICIDEMSQLMNRVDPTLLSSLSSQGFQPLNIRIYPQPPAEARESFFARAKQLNLMT